MQVLFVFPGSNFKMLDEFLKNSEVRIGYKLHKELSHLPENERLKYIRKVASYRNPNKSEPALKRTIGHWNSFFDKDLNYCIIPSEGRKLFYLVKLESKVRYEHSSDMPHIRKFKLIGKLINKNHYGINVICRVPSEKIIGLDERIKKFEKDQLKFENDKIPSSDPELECYEGEQIELLGKHLRRERDINFRNKYRAQYRHIVNCSTCEINGKDIYRLNDPNSFLELHHIEPLKYRQGSTKTTINDVKLLCPNCHKAIHRMMIEDELTSIKLEEFKKRIYSSFAKKL